MYLYLYLIDMDFIIVLFLLVLGYVYFVVLNESFVIYYYRDGFFFIGFVSKLFSRELLTIFL
jgi:hypothetical protein